MFEILKTSFKDLSKKLWLPSINYIIISALPLILGIQIFDKLMLLSENSLLLNKLVENFDFAIFTDFWRLNYGKLKNVLINAAWAIPFIYFLKLYVTGGNIDAVNEGFLDFKRYFRQCNKYFWRMFRLDIIHFCLLILIFALALGAIFILVPYLKDVNEIQIFVRLGPLLLLIIAIYCLIDLFKDYCIQRIYFSESHKIRITFIESMKFVFSFPKTYIFRIVFYGFSVIWLLAYLETEKRISGSGLLTVGLTIVCQQFYIIGKHFLRFWHLFLVQKIQNKRPVG
jgi:hypothetical protein